MKLFSEKVEPTFTNSTFNVLQTENFSEIFFDVYEIELNKIKYPAEKVSSFRGNPVVSVPVVIGEKEQEFPFVLIKGNESIFFNESNIEVPIDDTPVEVEDTDVLFESVDIDHDHRIKEDTKREIMEHIENAKVNARKQAESIKREKLKEADTEIRKKNKLLRESLDTAKQQLVKEFISITKSIKRELINEADDKYSELTLTIDNKINDLANTLAESIQSDFENSSKELETNIRAFVKAIHTESVLPELRKSLETIATDAVVRIKGIESDLDKKLTEKVDVSVIQELTSELDALRNTNVELNNSLNKGVNKALSRVGNVSTRLDEAVADITKQVDDKISATADNISNYYSDKLQVLEDQTFELNEKSRQYVVDIVRESRDNLISEIRKIQKEAPVEFVIESAGKKKTKSFDSIQKDIDKKISDRVSDEVIKLRKYIAVYSSGGGTVAQQFANGGVMNGNLTIVGTISASQYLGLSAGGGGGGVSGDYLPLSGGTITGSLSVFDGLSANSLNVANGTGGINKFDSGGITVNGITNAFGYQNQFNPQIKTASGTAAMTFRSGDVVCEREQFYVGGTDGSGTVYGSISGNTAIFRTISASTYLGLPTTSGDYLPLSGGTLTGGLSVNGDSQFYADYFNVDANFAINLSAPAINLNADSTLFFNSTDFSYPLGGAALHRTALGSGATGDALFQDNTLTEARETLGVIRRETTTDYTSNSTTLTEAPELTFPVEAGKVYRVDLALIVSSTAAVGGVQVAMSYPTLARTGFGWAQTQLHQTVKFPNLGASSVNLNPNTTGVPNGTTGLNGWVYLRPTSSGNVTFAAGQFSAGTGTVGLLTGSIITVTEI